MIAKRCHRVVVLLTIMLVLDGHRVAALGADRTVEDAVNVGSDKQLFLGPWDDSGRDKHLVASMKNVTMTMHEARATGERLLDLDQTWESARHPDVWMYPRSWVIRDGSVFRMYYAVFPRYPLAHHFTCYAESTDGIHWKKPKLGLYTWEGSAQNNIILPNDKLEYAVTSVAGATVFVDSHARNPQERVKKR